MWMGVSLRHLLDLAGVRPGAQVVRFGALDQPVVAGAPDFSKSLAIDHARDGEVMVAFAMNDEQLPLLNGFPIRLIVPGWFSTYWAKLLNDIEVLDQPDDGYWMAKAYKIPDTPLANVSPTDKDYPTVPINRMVPRSWITSIAGDHPVAWQPSLSIGGIAMGGDTGVARVNCPRTADGPGDQPVWGLIRASTASVALTEKFRSPRVAPSPSWPVAPIRQASPSQ